MAERRWTREKALDLVHRVIGNDLIKLKKEFMESIELWETVYGANEDDYEYITDGHSEDEHNMIAVEEDEPIPMDEEMSM